MKSFPQIDGIVVIFGTPGLAPVFDVYQVLHEKMQECTKPIYPVLPSVTTAREEVQEFLSRGHINFPDEVLLGQALTRIHNTEPPAGSKPYLEGIDIQALRRIIEEAEDGKEALEKCRDNLGKYRLVITDYSMPVMDGIDFIIELIKIDDSLPVVLVSGHKLRLMLAEKNTETEDIIKTVFKNQRLRYLSKPYKHEVFIKQVNFIKSVNYLKWKSTWKQ